MLHFLLYLGIFATGFYVGHPGGLARIIGFIKSKL